MQELQCDMWELAKDMQDSGLPPPLVFITTNGYVKASGEGVMGRGCAQEARDMFPGVQGHLGDSLASRGNVVDYLGTYNLDGHDFRLFTFPVKHHWRDKASLELIEDSCIRVQKLISKLEPGENIIIPRPGCGNGQLEWDIVKPILLSYLDYENVFVTYK